MAQPLTAVYIQKFNKFQNSDRFFLIRFLLTLNINMQLASHACFKYLFRYNHITKPNTPLFAN